MAPSTYIADGGEAPANVADGLADANTTFVAGQLRDDSATTSGITLTNTQFTEIEYAIQATSDATDSQTYYFRLTNNGSETNFTYVTGKYGQVTLAGTPLGPAIPRSAASSLTDCNLIVANVKLTLTYASYDTTLST